MSDDFNDVGSLNKMVEEYKLQKDNLENELLQSRSRVAALESELSEQLKKSTQFHALALQANFKLEMANKDKELKDQEIQRLTEKSKGI